ncbi:MAG TPA: DUF4912 domain-containing protein [Firmicutes bacterium]|nr:DUF4912 domain-containing protein [Bacillota bacterium]
MAVKPQGLLNRETLPEYYEEDRLVLLPRDPYSLFAYWEISVSTREHIRESWGEDIWRSSFPVLRICKHRWSRQGTIDNVTDINLKHGANNWYVHVNSPDHFYHAELGWRRPEGTFFSLLCSNLVRTPRDSISDLIDENWQLPDWKSRKLFRRISVYHLSSPELIRRLQK